MLLIQGDCPELFESVGDLVPNKRFSATKNTLIGKKQRHVRYRRPQKFLKKMDKYTAGTLRSGEHTDRHEKELLQIGGVASCVQKPHRELHMRDSRDVYPKNTDENAESVCHKVRCPDRVTVGWRRK